MPEMEIIVMGTRTDDRGETVLCWAIISLAEDGSVMGVRPANIEEIPNTEFGCLDVIDASIGMML